MKNKNDDTLDKLIRASMELDDTPSLELNTRLKASLYQREAVRQRQNATRAVSLWYLPMLLNFVTFALLTVLALLMIANPYLSKFMAAICLYMGVAGFFITALGIKRTKMKEEITVYLEKRGAAA